MINFFFCKKFSPIHNSHQNEKEKIFLILSKKKIIFYVKMRLSDWSDFDQNFYQMEIGKSVTCFLPEENFGKWKSIFGYVELFYIVAVFVQIFARFFAKVFLYRFFLRKIFYENFRLHEPIQCWSVFENRIELTAEFIFTGNLKYF